MSLRPKEEADLASTLQMLGGIQPGEKPSHRAMELLQFLLSESCDGANLYSQEELELRICHAFSLPVPIWDLPLFRKLEAQQIAHSASKEQGEANE